MDIHPYPQQTSCNRYGKPAVSLLLYHLPSHVSITSLRMCKFMIITLISHRFVHMVLRFTTP